MDGSGRPAPQGHEDLSERWVGAGHLKAGDRLKLADGSLGTVLNVTTVQQTREMFNLTVETAHTFYVGTNGWLVHNAIRTCSTTLQKIKDHIEDVDINTSGKLQGGHVESAFTTKGFTVQDTAAPARVSTGLRQTRVLDSGGNVVAPNKTLFDTNVANPYHWTTSEIERLITHVLSSPKRTLVNKNANISDGVSALYYAIFKRADGTLVHVEYAATRKTTGTGNKAVVDYVISTIYPVNK